MRSVFLLFLISLSFCCLTAQTLDANAIKAASNYGFIENKGQVIDQNNQPNPSVKFLCALPDLQVQVRDNGYSYEVKKEIRRIPDTEGKAPKGQKSPDLITYGIHRVDITFEGANQGWLWEASDAQADYSNFYTTGTGEAGITGVRTYRHLLARNVWDHIDIEFLASADAAQPVKYNIIVRPGGNLDAIRLRVAGADASAISSSGGLLFKTTYGDLEETIPLSFTERQGETDRENVQIRFKQLGKDVFGFELPDFFWATDKVLVIDPTPDRMWGTYYGGSEWEIGNACSTDASGNIHLAGDTRSFNNIATAGAHQTTQLGSSTAFLAKFNADGIRQWATYYGGGDSDYGTGCTVDASGNVYLVGDTYSANNISLNGHQNQIGGTSDAFLVKFNDSGVRQWATYYGGSEWELGYSCCTDPSGNVYMAGRTQSFTNISSGGHQNAYGGGFYDGFLVKFSANGVRQWATYYGGSGLDGVASCVSDVTGNVFVGGITTSTVNMASNGFQNSIGGVEDGFLAKFSGAGIRLWATYFGGSNSDEVLSCTTDNTGNIFISGRTRSISNIAFGGHQNTFGGGDSDAFLTKFNSAGNRIWATYYGGGSVDDGRCIVEQAGNIYLAGYTESSANISFMGYQNTFGGINDAFLCKFSDSGVREWATYYGGSISDIGVACTTDITGNVILTGLTYSNNNIAYNGHQNTHGGGPDAFLVKFTQVACNLSSSISATTSCPGQNNGSATVTATGGTTPYTYLWSNGQTSATATNLAAGVYTVTVTGSNGCTTSATATIANSPTAQASFIYTINGGQVTFSNTSTNASSYLWEFGNGQTSTQANPTVTFNTQGMYTVCLTATGTCELVNACQTVNITYDYCWNRQNPIIVAGKWVTGVYFVNSQIGWTSGEGGTILRTIDGGANWQKQNSGTTNGLVSIYFINNETGWAVGASGTILRTVDSGVTWQVQNSGTVNHLSSVYFVDDETGWAVGDSSIILHTIDSGVSWQMQNSGTANWVRFASVHFMDSLTGWIGGSGNTLIKTTNGGVSWQSKSIVGPSSGIDDIFFVNSQVGWAVSNYRVFRTLDGGETWPNYSSFPVGFLTDVQFLNSQIGWVAANSGRIFKSSNGGVSWQLQNTSSSEEIFGIHFVNEQTGWAVGQNGTILKYGQPVKPFVQNLTICKNAATQPLTAIGTNLLWYISATGGTGSATAPIPNTSTIGTTTYYVSQSPIGIGNCTESERSAITVTVTSPNISVSTTSGCSGNSTATASASGGVPPYSYQWSNNQSTQTISNLSSGTYTVTVTDASGCINSETATVNGGVPITASISNTAAPCIGQTNGSVTVNASGGTAPYTYLWSNGQTTATATQLAAGTYFIAVTDSNGCTATASYALTAIPPFSVSVQSAQEPGANTCQANATPAGGIAPHQYLWSNGQSTATATNLPQGSYNVLVTDATGCVAVGVGDCSTVQTHEIEGLEAFFVAPNPAQAGFTVYAKLAYPSKLKIQLVNTLGQHVYESTHSTQEIKEHIPVVNLPAGAYFLKISTPQGYKTEKISIMH